MLNIKMFICIYSFYSIYSAKYILHFYTQLKVKSGVNVEGWRGVARGGEGHGVVATWPMVNIVTELH